MTESDRRLLLQSLLEKILGSRAVYYQPPPSIKMVYPAIIYSRVAQQVKHADNTPYLRRRAYTVTVIDKNPDSDIPEKVANLPLCSFSQHFATEGLNHDLYLLYF